MAVAAVISISATTNYLKEVLRIFIVVNDLPFQFYPSVSIEGHFVHSNHHFAFYSVTPQQPGEYY